MPWNLPKTWQSGEVVGETDINTYLRDNIVQLFYPAQRLIVTGSATELSVTASTAVPISTADLSLVLTTYGGEVQVYFGAVISGGRAQLGLTVDGTAWGNWASGITRNHDPVEHQPMSYHVWVTGLASGAHTFQPTWATTGNTIQLKWSANPAVLWAQEG